MNASLLAAALENTLNRYLQQDAANAARLATLDGKAIALTLSGTGLTWYFLVDKTGVQVLNHYEGDVDTHLQGNPLGFARLALGQREDALFKGAVHIEGDTETGQAFQALLAETDWDWEEQLSHLTGDVVAHQAGRLAAHLGAAWREARVTLEQDFSEYLQEEARLLPTRFEVEEFLDSVDQLRDDTERLCARVERLRKSLESPS